MARGPVVAAVVVTYTPELDGLILSLRSLAAQVELVIVVDNGSAAQNALSLALAAFDRCIFEPQKGNLGLGSALNTGVERARSLKATHVLLMDQDSVPCPRMVDLMVMHLDGFMGDRPVAAIGPRFVDVNNGAVSQHVHFESLRIGRIPCVENAPCLSTDFLITSGSLIPIQVLDDVGPMDESLFIDHVDTEWCLRAKSKGYALLGDCEALLEHDLGEYRKRIWFGRWRDVPVHKAFRYYYIFRNSILLYRRKYIPWAWIRVDLIRLVYILGFSILFGPDRLNKMAMMWKGVRDGLRGVTGRLDT
ncbi:MAG TPA: glycosyltransferase family 2 protein [Halothiobacillus sp.]|nr:glycosyltransferase family 2 protein [Halothiobacillus sp.]